MSGQADKPVPERIGKYEIVGVLGQGGMGVVYRGRDPRIGRDVAIKTLTEGFSGESEMLKRFYQEAGHTGNLRHPNIVTVYDFGDEAGLPYIVMEFLDGEPLDKLIHARDALHLRSKLDIMAQVCAALDYAHRQGMIHRDVKPANVIVQRDGLVKLLDFGIARAGGHQPLNQSMTRTGTLVGTPAYISPERLRGEMFDGRSDIFAAGVVLYQLLTGSLPFSAEYPAILHQILNDDPPPLGKYLASYPPQLDHVIQRALAKDPMDRYPSADEMAADLSAAALALKTQHLEELMTAARTATDAQDFARAQSVLGQVLRVDAQHAEAKEMMAVVDRFFNVQKVRQRVEQLKKVAEEAIEARNWDQARTVCTEAQHLDSGNAEIGSLLARANAGKQAKEQIHKLIREAEAARHAGSFEQARVLAGEALALDPQDSRIIAVCRVLDQEAQEQRTRLHVQSLLQSAQENLSASSLAAAWRALVEAESLAASDPELLRLKDEVAAALLREDRQKRVNALEDKAGIAITLEQLQEVAAEVKAALAELPAEPTLLRLKMELDPRLREHENRRLVAEVTDACAKLSPTDALARIHEALVRLPGNADLLKLEAAISQRLTRAQRERLLTEYMAKARALLDDHLYLETVKLLEQCEREGLSSPELTGLMNLARSSAADRMSQDLVERSLLEAKRLFDAQDYEEVLRLLTPVLERVEEPSLRKLFDESARSQQALEQRVEAVLAQVQCLNELELFDAAIGLVAAESSGVKQAKRVQAALQSSTALLEGETARLATIGAAYAAINGPAGAAAFQKLSSGAAAQNKPAGTVEIEQRLSSRVQQLADRQVMKAVEAARQALTADDPTTAETLLQNVSASVPIASPTAQAEWRTVQTDAAGARKVLRFRKTSRR